MPRPRADHAMILYDDMVYFVGGWRDSGEGRVLVAEVDRCVGEAGGPEPRRAAWSTDREERRTTEEANNPCTALECVGRSWGGG